MPDKTKNSLLALVVLASIYNVYMLHNLAGRLDNSMIDLKDNISAVRISTEGKLKSLDEKCKSIAETRTTNTVTREVSYIEKSSAADADVELKTEKPAVKVNVNGRETYRFNLLENETSKFDQGKLMITSSSVSDINITATEPKRSKFSIITAMNSDKKVLGGLNYELGSCVSATVISGQNLRPYYGLTWKIGSRR